MCSWARMHILPEFDNNTTKILIKISCSISEPWPKKLHRSCLLCRDWKKAVLGLIWGPWIYSEAGAANNLVIPVMSEIWKKQCHVTNTIRIKFGPELVLFRPDPLRSCKRFWLWVIGPYPYSTSSQTRTRMCILIAELLFYFTVFLLLLLANRHLHIIGKWTQEFVNQDLLCALVCKRFAVSYCYWYHHHNININIISS